MIEESDNKKRIEHLKQKSHVHLASMSFFLDDNYRISGFTTQVIDILLYGEEELLGKPLRDILMPESKPVWENFLSGISQEKEYGHSLILSFQGKPPLLSTICLVSALSAPRNCGSVLITAIDTAPGKEVMETEQGKNTHQHRLSKALPITLGDSELKNIQKVQEYIAVHLAEPYSSIKELAYKLGTSEFKLRYGFKQLYGTTVFQYLQNERLRKAKYLTQHSELPLKKIAKMTGFKNATHFSRVFKEQYGISPGKFRRLSREKKDD